MPKAILEFNLPDEQHEFNQAISGSKALCAIGEIRDLFRDHTKHRSPNEDYKTPDDLIEALEKEFYGILNENEIPFLEL